jgi:hypothetical protein
MIALQQWLSLRLHILSFTLLQLMWLLEGQVPITIDVDDIDDADESITVLLDDNDEDESLLVV